MRRLALSLIPLLLTGCAMTPLAPPSTHAGAKIRGVLHGGQQPVVGAKVYLFAANANGYGGYGIPDSAGNASISLLDPFSTGQIDSIGAYVLTDANGNFTISGDYTCTENQQVYLYGQGGNPGAGINTAATFMAVLGVCPASGSLVSVAPTVTINEVTTVAAAYALAGFATDPIHISSSGTPLALTGIANAFANAANLVNLASGTALGSTPAGTGTVPAATINTIANILATCVNSTGPTSTACTTLFTNALNGTIPATGTSRAAMNIAHNPGSNIAALFGLPDATAPFSPSLASQPNDFSVGINYTGGGLDFPVSIAIDSSGNAWIADDNLIEISRSGGFLSGRTGFSTGTSGGVVVIDNSSNLWLTGGGLTKVAPSGTVIFRQAITWLAGIAIDGSGHEWIASEDTSYVKELDSAGSLVTGEPLTGYAAGPTPNALAVDGGGNVWIANAGSGGSLQGSLGEISSSGVPVSPLGIGSTAGGVTHPFFIAIDGSGSAWFTNIDSGGIFKTSPAGTVVSPSGGFNDGAPTGSSVQSLAIDGAGNIWIANPAVGSFKGSVAVLSKSGAVLSPGVGFTGGQLNNPADIAIDGSGNVWTGNFNPSGSSVTEFIGLATPVVTPICAGLPATPTSDGSSNLGTRP